MTYYEIIKKYGEGKGPDAMWRATKRISEHLEELKEHHPEKLNLQRASTSTMRVLNLFITTAHLGGGF